MEIFKGAGEATPDLACYCQYKCENPSYYPHCNDGQYNYGTAWDAWRGLYQP